MLRQPDLRYFSWTANWTRALGSAMVVVFFALHYGLADRFLLTIGTAAAIVDAVFLYLFRQKLRAAAG